jgi:hypothetical protein
MIGGNMGLIGGIWSGVNQSVQMGLNQQQIDEQQAFQRQQWEDQTAFRDMAYEDQTAFRDMTYEETKQREDNAAQRRAQDLEQAGINPLLAGGMPATASGTSAPVGMAGVSGQSSGVTSGTGSFDIDAVSMMQGINNIKAQKAQIANIQADTANKEAQNPNLKKQEELTTAQINKAKADTSKTYAEQVDTIANTLRNSTQVTGSIEGSVGIGQNTAKYKTELKESSYDIAKKIASGEITAEQGTQMMNNRTNNIDNIGETAKKAGDGLKSMLESSKKK